MNERIEPQTLTQIQFLSDEAIRSHLPKFVHLWAALSNLSVREVIEATQQPAADEWRRPRVTQQLVTIFDRSLPLRRGGSKNPLAPSPEPHTHEGLHVSLSSLSSQESGSADTWTIVDDSKPLE